MFEKIGQTLSNFFATSVGAIVHALLLLALAFIAAAIAKMLVTKLLNVPKIKSAVSKVDTADNPGGTISFIGKLVYFIVFILFRKYIMRGVSRSGIKG